MCGIAGILRLDGGPVDGRPLERLLAALSHRGPDGSGVIVDGQVGFGHRRLSILDPTDAGRQPMRRGRAVLVHNGEIYNYLELAAELREHGEVFASGTDTEVILAAYAHWGPDAVTRFNGMFAFALWDEERRRLVLARDRMGVKPLYIRRSRRSLGFASELQAFVAAGSLDEDDGWTPAPRPGVIHDFLARGWTDHTSETFVAGVDALPPAHLLIVSDTGEQLVRYWDAPDLAADDRPGRPTDRARDDALVEEFRATFDSSVRLHLRSDVPIGTCLSGGLDSSSIVATVSGLLAAERRGPHEEAPRLGIHARYPDQGVDESAYASAVAAAAGIPLAYAASPHTSLLASILPVLRAQGEPFASGSMAAQYTVMEAARLAGVKVLLDGQGADELLGGYDLFQGARAAGLLLAGKPLAAAHELRGQVAGSSVSAGAAMLRAAHAGLPRSLVEAIRTAGSGRYGIACSGELRGQTAATPPRSRGGTFLATRLWHALTVDSLPALLRYEDRNSMAFGIEARVPFLDVRLIELCVQLPDRLRIDGGTTKAILRRAVGDRLPAQVARRRDKVGFEVPQRAWLTAGRDDIGALLRGGQVVDRGWVSRREVDRVIRAGFGGGRGTDHLWRLVIVEAWLRMVWPSGTSVGGRDVWEAGMVASGQPRSAPS